MTEVERFWSRVQRTDGCWLWLGAPNSKEGYGRFSRDDRSRVMAHRFAYELEVGPIPDGLTLDHLCRNTMCVRPTHLEPVTNEENILRGQGSPAQNARKTHCKRGHPFDAENTIERADGYRECRTCYRLHQRVHDLREKGCEVKWLEDGDALVAIPFDVLPKL